MTVPTLAVAVSLVPNPAMFFSMMALISSAHDAIVVPPVCIDPRSDCFVMHLVSARDSTTALGKSFCYLFVLTVGTHR